ncbi:MAG: ABC transporter ATP-binding protein/permease, partial [Candidatus Hydrothermae bacterium]|nr:ABC transporter ATP-binding protein/permease [Candidatus Hydrothermae bacterium]
MLIKWIFDEALGDRNLSRFGFLIAGYLCLSLFINTSHFLLSIWQKRVENFLIRDWELHLLKKMFWVDVSMLRDHSSGYMVSKIHRDTQELITSVIHFLIDTSTRITSTFVFGTVLFVISWKASIILLLIIPPLMIYGRHVGFHVGSLSEKEREAEAQWIKILNQCIESVHWLQSFPDLMEKTFKTARDVLRSYLGRIYEIHRHIKTQHTLNDIVMGISDVVSMSVGAFFVFKGEITFGGYLAFVNAFWRAIQGMVSLMDKIPEYHRVIGIWNTFEKLSHLFPQSPSFSIPPCMDDGIRLSHVRVCKGDVCLLDVPEFAVSAGEKVLIVGPNGSGKTTLIQVIAGLLSPSSGDICRPASTVSLTQPIILPPLEVRSLIPGEIARHIGVEHLLDRTPDRLSMGERTRVALGMLLFSN